MDTWKIALFLCAGELFHFLKYFSLSLSPSFVCYAVNLNMSIERKKKKTQINRTENDALIYSMIGCLMCHK